MNAANPAAHSVSQSPIIGLDVGGSTLKSGLVNLRLPRICDMRETPIESNGSAPQILRNVHAIIGAHLTHTAIAASVSIGIAFPGPFDYSAGICWIQGLAKYAALYGVNITQALQSYGDLARATIRYRNDAEAAVVGEAVFGAGRGYSRIIGLTLGTGCGSSFLENGRPLTSGEGVPANGWLYPMLYQGARADDLFSTRGLAARLACASGTPQPNINLASDLARSGDKALLQGFHSFGHDLGTFLLGFVERFKPEAVLVLGGIAQAFDLFGLALQNMLAVPVLVGQLGNAASLYGAALLFSSHPV